MTIASPLLISKLTVEELKSLGPAESLPAIQPTTEGVSATSLEGAASPLSIGQDYKEVVDLRDPKSRTRSLLAMDESEQGPGPTVSDSEDDQNAGPRTLNVSERRKAQNSKFSAW